MIVWYALDDLYLVKEGGIDIITTSLVGRPSELCTSAMRLGVGDVEYDSK